MSEELKSCPFCSRKANAYSIDITGPYDRSIKTVWAIGCDTGGCQGKWGACSFITKEQAIENWNTRSSPWRPIETAPKDATEVIIYEAKHGEVMIAWWQSGDDEWVTNTPLNPRTPTHWMPIPEAP